MVLYPVVKVLRMYMYVAILHVDLDLVLVELPATCNLCVPFGTTYTTYYVLLYYCTTVLL
jgi:hypothetical protein